MIAKNVMELSAHLKTQDQKATHYDSMLTFKKVDCLWIDDKQIALNKHFNFKN